MLRWLVLLFATAVSVIPARAQVPAKVTVTAFVNVAVIPMDRERVLAGQTVIVRGDRIVAMSPVGRVAVPAEAVRVDGRGQFLMPGLADMHVHLWDDLKYGTVAPNVTDVLAALVANGITTVREMHSGGPTSATLALRRRVASGELLGPRIYTAGDPDISSPEAAAKSVPALKAAGHDFLKVYFWDDMRVYDSIQAAAARVGLRLVGHVPNKEMTLEKIAQGHWASMEHLLSYYEWATEWAWNPDPAKQVKPPRADDAAIRKIALATRRAGVWNCPTLTVVTRTIDWNPDAAPMVDFNFRLIKALHDVGAGVLLGTDAPYVMPGFSIHQELEMLVEAGLTPYQALETGTRNVARFLGTEDSTGTIAVGKRADLVLLRANPLVNIRHTTALAGVMLGGRWLPREELEQRLDAAKPDSLGQAGYGTFDVKLRLARWWLWQ